METHQRIAAFKEEIAGLELSAPSDSQDRVWLIGSVVLFVAGLVTIFLGYWGASGTPWVNEQMPYVISGGLLGLALATAGAVLYTRYSMTRYLRFWLIRMVYEQRLQTDRLVEALGAADGRAAAPDGQPVAAGGTAVRERGDVQRPDLPPTSGS